MANGLWPVINVSNVDKSVEFYKSLGLRTRMEHMGPMRWANVDVGDSGLMIWPKDDVAPDQPADTRAWLSGELGKGVLFILGVPNADKTWQKAQAARANVDTPIKEQDWGGKAFNLIDPDGYVICFMDKFPNAPGRKAAKPKPRTSAKKKGARARPASGKKRVAAKRRR